MADSWCDKRVNGISRSPSTDGDEEVNLAVGADLEVLGVGHDLTVNRNGDTRSESVLERRIAVGERIDHRTHRGAVDHNDAVAVGERSEIGGQMSAHHVGEPNCSWAGYSGWLVVL